MKHDDNEIETLYNEIKSWEAPPATPAEDPRYPTPDELIAIAAAFWNRFQDNDPPVAWESLSPEGRANRVLELAEYGSVLADLGFEVVRVAK